MGSSTVNFAIYTASGLEKSIHLPVKRTVSPCSILSWMRDAAKIPGGDKAPPNPRPGGVAKMAKNLNLLSWIGVFSTARFPLVFLESLLGS